MLTEYIYDQLSNIYNVVGVTKRFDPIQDVILVLGGSTTSFGQKLCQILVHKYKAKIVNFDRYDDPNFRCPGLYHFIRCDFTSRKSVHNAFSQAKLLGFSFTMLINNVNELLEGISDQNPLKNCRDMINANLINVMISTKNFITQLVNVDDDIYIINITTQPNLNQDQCNRSTYYDLAHSGLIQFHDGMSSELRLNEINHGKKYKPLLIYIPSKRDERVEKIVNNFIELILEGREGVEYLYNGIMSYSTIVQIVRHYINAYCHCGQW
ncbi:hypothetical protein C6P45_002159 [Maudiozyma exigua]|uniref:Uncharacterized protein n=1 Tax=Maudiozyma exigua TaxID=34358 RepID=A0A9P6WCW8_MAUEX|nr:hypothetical protein C6P45_002159 [Kazachstania exigua]